MLRMQVPEFEENEDISTDVLKDRILDMVKALREMQADHRAGKEVNLDSETLDSLDEIDFDKLTLSVLYTEQEHFVLVLR